jgi:hypothetical protein
VSLASACLRLATPTNTALTRDFVDGGCARAIISGSARSVYNTVMARHLHLQARLLTLLLVTALLLVLVAALAAGGQLSASAGTSTPPCATNVSAGSLPTALHVERTSYLPQFPTREYRVRDVAAVQRLYAAACALPVLAPNNATSCPSGFGLVYQLTFLGTSTPVRSMELHDGCWRLTIGSEVHATNPSFLSLVARTLRIPSLVPTVVGFSPTTESDLV